MQSNSIVFLYTELAGYTLACLKELSQRGIAVHVFNYPINKEAPFEFKAHPGISFYNRFDFNLDQLLARVSEISPLAIICSGWIDKEYLKVCTRFKRKCKTILALDTKWEGLWKQHLATLLSPFLIKKKFAYAWVPGKLQANYAKKLGFKKNTIYKGFYSCDFNTFNQYYNTAKANKETKFPHRFIFVGRYYTFKGIIDLWQAFIELQTDFPSDWELWCLGTGDLTPVVHPKIKHFGFVQPEEIKKYISTTGIFVLPSRKEPWGVVVHEFAAAGFPLLCSNKVGAAEQFLEEGKNGYMFESGNMKELKNALLKMMQSDDKLLQKMGAESNNKASKITPETWADTLLTICGY